MLAPVKLIAEPWDVGAGRLPLGAFPAPWAEWNDRYRDTVRAAGREPQLPPAAAAVGCGTSPTGCPARRTCSRRAGGGRWRRSTSSPRTTASRCATWCPTSSKHNEANGEDNRDGSDNNRSWNYGVEGSTDDPDVLQLRRRMMRNLLPTLLLSTGVPMLTAGDEIGRTQRGNNNAYCQDNEMSWLAWARRAVAAGPARLDPRPARPAPRSTPCCASDDFFDGRPARPDGTKDLAWFGADGHEMRAERWFDARPAGARGVPGGQGRRRRRRAGPVAARAAATRGRAGAGMRLPGPPWGTAYDVLLDTAAERPAPGPTLAEGEVAELAPHSAQVLAARR